MWRPHHRIQRVAILGVKLVAEAVEFLHGILPHIDCRAAPLRVIHIAAVNERGVAAALIGDAAEFGDGKPAHRAVDRSGARQQLREHEKIPLQHR